MPQAHPTPSEEELILAVGTATGTAFGTPRRGTGRRSSRSHLWPAGSGIYDLRSASQAIEAPVLKMRGFYMQYLDSKWQADSIGTLQTPIGTRRAPSQEFLSGWLWQRWG